MDVVQDRAKTREQFLAELTGQRVRLAALESAGGPNGAPAGDLRWSREQLEAILRTAADGITVQGPDGRLLFANDGAARLTGYPSAGAFLAAPLAEVISRTACPRRDCGSQGGIAAEALGVVDVLVAGQPAIARLAEYGQ